MHSQRYATFLLGLPYSAAPQYPSSVGSIARPHEGHRFCGHSMLQHGLSADEWALVGDRLEDGFEMSQEQPPPLFLHANLLKHAGRSACRLSFPLWTCLVANQLSTSTDNRPGSTFQSVKTPSTDPSFLESDLRFKVSMYRGMCTDIWDGSLSLDGGAGNHGEEQVEGSFEMGRVGIEDFKQAWGGLLRDFEEVSAAACGKWREVAEDLYDWDCADVL